MPTQAEIDTAAAKAKQGGDQAAKDTAAAKAKQNNNNQAAKDTARAKSRQNGGDGGTAADFAAREAAAGLYLAGNDTMSGRGLDGPTFSQREESAGLTLGGNSTTSGRVAENAASPSFPQVGTPSGDESFTSTMVNGGGGGGGGGPAGLEIIWADETSTFITTDILYEDYTGSGYWSLVLGVTNTGFTKLYSFDAVATISSASEYRLRLYTPYINSDGDAATTKLSTLGQYRATVICIDGSGRAVLVKIA
tara:strand:+ start:1297 stop:2046 length:750 start_codon:yes stop_codon:yes gene_type:complete